MKFLIGNKVTEKDVRAWLDNQGFAGRSAKFIELELYAIQRPGWRQVFKFVVDARRKSDQQRTRYYGAVRDDERYSRTEIEMFPQPAQQHARLNEWSRDMIRQTRNSGGSLPDGEVSTLSPRALLMFAVGFIAVALLLAALASILN